LRESGRESEKTNGCKNSRAEERIAAESVEQRVFGAGDVGVDPLDIRQLLNDEFADRTLFTFSNPF
jgi:hypothetical protein